MKEDKLPVVFAIELSNRKAAEVIAQDAGGAKVLTFQSGHNVTPEQFKNGVTYLDLMEENLTALKEALN